MKHQDLPLPQRRHAQLHGPGMLPVLLQPEREVKVCFSDPDYRWPGTQCKSPVFVPFGIAPDQDLKPTAGKGSGKIAGRLPRPVLVDVDFYISLLDHPGFTVLPDKHPVAVYGKNFPVVAFDVYPVVVYVNTASVAPAHVNFIASDDGLFPAAVDAL
jgi:hypothetical protein